MAEKEQAASIAAARSTCQWRSAEEAAALGASGSELKHAYSVLRELAGGTHDKELGTVVGWWVISSLLARGTLRCSIRAGPTVDQTLTGVGLASGVGPLQAQGALSTTHFTPSALSCACTTSFT